MRKILLLVYLPLAALAQPLHVTSPVRFLALGDSYTIGQSVPSADNWPHQLVDSLAVRGIPTDTLRIIATTGWRTDNLLTAITNQGLDSGRFDLVSLLIGVNNQYQGVPFSQYAMQFPQLIDSAIRYAGGDTTHVFIVSIPDYAYTPFGLQTGDTQTISMQIDTYNLVGRQIADSFHIRYFDITPISRMGLAEPALVTTDGLHPSALQYSMWIDLMLKSIDSAMITAGISALHASPGISVYPNPANDAITITLPDLSLPCQVEICDMMGRLIKREDMPSSSTIISVSDMSDGIYTLRVHSADQDMIIKIIKQ